MATKRLALSTIDNPYNPITDFVHWYIWDAPRYACSSILARVYTQYYGEAHSLSDPEEAAAIEDCIDRIVKADPAGIFIKVVES